MPSITELIAWGKCPGRRVPVVVQSRPGWILGVFWAAESDLQSVVDLNTAVRKCRGLEGTGFSIDCDADALLCRCEMLSLELVWEQLAPDGIVRQRYDCQSKIFKEGDRLWEASYDGLLPVIAQDMTTDEVLMLAWVNREAWEESLRTETMCYFSRSKQRLWRKGEESGNRQLIKNIRMCVGGGLPHTLLLNVEQIGGAACHAGYCSCFFRSVGPDGGLSIVGERVFDPAQVYRKKGE